MRPATIRRAVAFEAAILTSIALESKRHWGYPAAWMLLWRDVLTITEAFVSEHEVFAAESDGRLTGFYTLLRANGRWELDHLYVRPSDMGQGIGRSLFEHAVLRLHALAPGVTLFIEADPNAEAFYLRMGAKRVGEIARDWQGLERVLPELAFSPGP